MPDWKEFPSLQNMIPYQCQMCVKRVRVCNHFLCDVWQYAGVYLRIRNAPT